MELYNTMTRKKEVFKPIKDKEVRMYSCGPTVYNYAHIGNMRPYIVIDILKRLLLHDGYKVIHVMNITDVGHLVGDGNLGEDKLKMTASREHISVYEVAKFYESKFLEDIKHLNILFPTYLVRASEHVEEMLQLIRKLDEKGFLYKLDTGIYYDTSKFKDYGKLMGMDFEKLNKYLKAGARVERTAGIRNITDFAVWRFASESEKEMVWDCEYGHGFPGWHIECSAMSMKYLGEHFDLHSGGVDHIPIHHTNEIAQSEGATGKAFVNYWMHVEFLSVDGRKMSKSLHNTYTIGDLMERGYTPMAYRYFVAASHYRSPLNFTFAALENAQRTLELIYSFARKVGRIAKAGASYPTLKEDMEEIEKSRKAFFAFANDDLDMPHAIAELHAIINKVNKMIEENSLSSESAKEVLSVLFDIDSVLGLGIEENAKEQSLPEEAEKLMEEREKARSEKNFDKADLIRKKLLEDFGIVVEDTPHGASWHYANP
ncbi:MAG: cysteine--tRNA ligase [Candidatus Micrarchaeaceae archaeon]